MKIIDLLNKIANGEEIPQEIQFGSKYIWSNNYKSYLRADDLESLTSIWNIFNCLNDEVEIIEEKKMPKKVDRTKCVDFADTLEKTLDTLDNLIDYLNSKGE